MALSSSFMFLMFSSLLVASLVLNVSTVDGSRKVVLKSEGHPIIDLKDPRVQEIGKFAVNEHNKEAKTNLVYKSVIKGEVFLDTSGTSYWLTILTTNNDKYLANVLDRPLERLTSDWSSRQLDLPFCLLPSLMPGLEHVLELNLGSEAFVKDPARFHMSVIGWITLQPVHQARLITLDALIPSDSHFLK
ncbi:hypothetical protein LguiA_030431 [Lonicera macranthoides]